MRFSRLQHFVMAIMLGCALVLSVISSVIAYNIIQTQAHADSVELTNNLIEAIRPTAAAAVFSGNELLAQDAINGLLANEAIYAVELVGFADDDNKGFKLSGINKQGGTGLPPVTTKLQALFGTQQMGELTVQPRMEAVKKNAMDSAVNMIMTLVIVIFASAFVTAQLIKWLLSKPLVNVVEQLKQVSPGTEQRLTLAEHLKPNEIGWLVTEFNTMLDRMKEAILTERGLRRDMELVQQSLEKAKLVAEQATEAKSNFLATMSHEIRTPMNSVLGFLELAMEADDLGDQTRRHLQIAQSSARFLLQLINDILDVSKIESGKLELDIHPFDLAAMLQETHDLMEIKAQEKSLALNLTTPAQLAPSYNSDPYRLRQILINLVGNAIKFTDKGSVDILMVDVGDNHFEFAIVDTGIGIAEDKIDSILKPFTQVDASITRQYGGTGLGTTISSELVQLLGGELKIQSILGKGSRFYFTIPLEPLDVVTKTVSKQQTETVASRALNILLVDDVVENTALAKIHLERAGHTVATAENGLEAVKATAEQNFDLVLMDIQMPEMDGYDATVAIRKQNEHNAKMPIVAMTANAMKQEQDKVKAVGMDDIVVKPIDFNVLFDTVNRLTDDGSTTQTKAKPLASAPSKTKLVDIQAALASWLEEDAYHKALGNFLQRNSQTLEELAVVINSGNVSTADSLVHKIKGAAGNLRLMALFESSCELEEQLHKDDAELSVEMFKPFATVLRDTLKAIEKVIGTVQQKSIENEVAPMDTQACTAAFNTLMEACEHHDPDAAEEAIALLGQYIQCNELSTINNLLQQFDFYEATDRINQLAEKMAIEIKTP